MLAALRHNDPLDHGSSTDDMGHVRYLLLDDADPRALIAGESSSRQCVRAFLWRGTVFYRDEADAPQPVTAPSTGAEKLSFFRSLRRPRIPAFVVSETDPQSIVSADGYRFKPIKH